MKALNVTRNKILVEMTPDELFRISEALDAVISQYEILEKGAVEFPQSIYQEIHEELCEMIVHIFDGDGNIIST